ncbi:amino acid ABC transporter permease [Atopobacter sp. AH10]|uniref:amino acid ABC transporter permease n=1 Tax=Atopobacter sp. AH10 TaxID=2315861 RepID=UPI000EF29206|nr:amino acid ABC transporter permease [Atopobacter sp. AH10]RLK63923.1 amino acid ABC transporter permease [Atopobacter sp. AH10]
MDWTFIKNYLPLYERATVLTLQIGLLGVLGAIVLGLVCTVIQHHRLFGWKWIVGSYIEVSRNTPLLIQLFFMYYGLPKLGLQLNAYTCGALGLTFLGGSYMAEAFRSGIESVGQKQEESALSLGLSKGQCFLYVILPQAIRVSFPAIMANVIFLLKETSVFSAISLMDLTFTAKDLIGLYSKTIESLALLVFFYLLILLPVSLLGALIERRLSYGQFRA